MTDESPARLRMTRRFNVSAERVFDAWLDPSLVTQWLFTSPGSEHHEVSLDARVGGGWSITDRRAHITYTASGEYLELDRPRRLVLTFQMRQFSPNTDKLTVELVPDGTGCIMTFTQEGIDIAKEVSELPSGVEGGTELGWRAMFVTLAAVVGATIETPASEQRPEPKRVMVQYTVKAEEVAANEAQIAQVFEQLAHERPAGLAYRVFKLADGKTFVHFSVEIPGAGPPLLELSSFKQFLAGVWNRCEGPPTMAGVQELGAYELRAPD